MKERKQPGGRKDKERRWCLLIFSPSSQISTCTSKRSAGMLLFLHLPNPLHLGSSWLFLCFLVVFPSFMSMVYLTPFLCLCFLYLPLCSHHLPLCSSPCAMLPFTVNKKTSANTHTILFSGLLPLVLGVKGIYNYHVNKNHNPARNLSVTNGAWWRSASCTSSSV